MLRTGGLETTSPQAEQFHSRIFAGTRRLVFLAVSGVTSSSVSRAGVFQAAKMGCRGWEHRSSMGSMMRTGFPRSPLPWLAQHLVN